MPSTFEFCLPTTAADVPDHPVWLHEVKYDGYRLRLGRDGNRVRLRGGHDWSGRFPWIVEAVLKNRHQQFVIDGEAVLLGADGISDFNALHSRRLDEEAQLYGFDCLALDGEDLRALPLSTRKTNLARLLPAARTASSSPRSSKARSARTCSGRHATWAWRVCRSGPTAPIAPGDRRTG